MVSSFKIRDNRRSSTDFNTALKSNVFCYQASYNNFTNYFLNINIKLDYRSPYLKEYRDEGEANNPAYMRHLK